MVPVSGKTGDGLNSLIAEIFRRSETQLMTTLQQTDQFEANVLEVSVVYSVDSFDNLSSTIGQIDPRSWNRH